MSSDEFKHLVKGEIERMVREDPENSITTDGTPLFDSPLIGFVDGDDPLFEQLKDVIGPFHLTPREAITEIARKKGVSIPESVGVISYILPITEMTRKENAGMDDGPSERWSHTRLYGEKFNKRIARRIASMLNDQGCFAIVPEDEEIFRTVEDDRVGKASTWSQRHVAYAAGLGTFGLSDGLITPRGKAHRIGSVIASFPLDSPKRPEDIHRYCLFHRKGSCKACAKRCPVGAITEKGHDKARCADFVFGQNDRINREYGIDIYGCGLCQVGVPCESRIPKGLE